MNPIIFSSGIKKIPNLSDFLKDSPTFSFENSVIGWGFRPTANKARDYAVKHNLRYIALEDGFLRSIGLGVEGYPPFSLVVDDVGIYYAAEKPSRLEKLIADCSLNDEQAQQSHQAMVLIREWQLSKYNHAPCEPVA
ncbi:capsular polysaccharide biosynthesis protein, partial [Avibacterium avium]